MNINIRLLSKEFQKMSLYLLMLFFAVISTFGMYACTAVMSHTDMSMSMSTQAETSIDECMNQSSDASCAMNVDDHPKGWQQVVNSLVAPNILSFILSVILLVVFLGFAFQKRFSKEDGEVAFTLYKKAHPNIRLYHYLPQLFSRGILQPKLYA